MCFKAILTSGTLRPSRDVGKRKTSLRLRLHFIRAVVWLPGDRPSSGFDSREGQGLGSLFRGSTPRTASSGVPPVTINAKPSLL